MNCSLAETKFVRRKTVWLNSESLSLFIKVHEEVQVQVISDKQAMQAKCTLNSKLKTHFYALCPQHT